MTAERKKTTTAQERYTAEAWHTSLQAGVFFLGLLAVPLVPRLNVAFVFLLGVLSLFYILAIDKDIKGVTRGFEKSWVITLFACLCAYLFINSFWAEDLGAALGKAVLVTLYGAAVLLSIRAFERQSERALQLAARALIWGAAIGFGIACFEFATGHLIQWAILKTLPAIRPEGNSIEVLVEHNGVMSKLPPSQYRNPPENEILIIKTDGLNRNLSSLLLVFWPALLLALRIFTGRLRWTVTGFIALTGAITILVGSSQTAVLALAAGALTFLAARAWPVFTARTIAVIWCVAVLLALPLVLAPYKAEWHKSDWLFDTARDRVAIWGFTAERTMQAPVLGVGIRSTRFIGRRLKGTLEQDPELVAPKRLGLHAHNNFLQVWFELGAVGVALVLALGLALLGIMRRMTDGIRPYTFATFTTACFIAAFGWGLWQSWLLAGYAMAIVLIGLSARIPAAQKDLD